MRTLFFWIISIYIYIDKYGVYYSRIVRFTYMFRCLCVLDPIRIRSTVVRTEKKKQKKTSLLQTRWQGTLPVRLRRCRGRCIKVFPFWLFLCARVRFVSFMRESRPNVLSKSKRMNKDVMRYTTTIVCSTLPPLFIRLKVIRSCISMQQNHIHRRGLFRVACSFLLLNRNAQLRCT